MIRAELIHNDPRSKQVTARNLGTIDAIPGVIDVEGTKLTLTQHEAGSLDGSQEAVVATGELLRGHGKHVSRDHRTLQMNAQGNGEVTLSTTMSFRLTTLPDEPQQIGGWAGDGIGSNPWKSLSQMGRNEGGITPTPRPKREVSEASKDATPIFPVEGKINW